MKEPRSEGESTTISSSRPPQASIRAEKHIIVDHERSRVHLVSSPGQIPHVPVPVLSGFQLLTSTGLFTDPRISAHLIASIHLANQNARFQIPLIPLAVQMPNSQIYPSGVQISDHMQQAAMPLPTPVTSSMQQQQLDLFKSWVNEKQDDDDELILNQGSTYILNGNSTPLTPPTMTTTTTNTPTTTIMKKKDLDVVMSCGNIKTEKEKNDGRKRRENNNALATSKKNKRNKLQTDNQLLIPAQNMDLKSLLLAQQNHVNLDNGIQLTDLNLTNSATSRVSPGKKAEKAVKKRKYLKKDPIQMEPFNQTPAVNNNHNQNSQQSNANINNNNISLNNNQNSRDKTFSCPICNRTFGYKHVLQNHERTHTGEKPFECNICSKKFTRDHHLKTHMRLHTGEKPYQCSHCDRQFVQVANLRRHLRVHTGEKPYSCELCDSKFSDSNQLKAHNLVHKGEKPYSCGECNGRFRRRHHLINHKCNNNNSVAVKDRIASIIENKKEHFLPSISPPFSSLTTTTATTESSGSHGSRSSSNSSSKRERKPRKTRRILRDVDGLPIPTLSGSSAAKDQFLPIPPEQTHAEDLSLSRGSGIALKQAPRHFSGSHSSVSTSLSPSPPTSGGSHHGSLFAYSDMSPPPDFMSSDDEHHGNSITPPTSCGSNNKDSEEGISPV